ncbi:MAG TPA: ribosome biogenesis GTPase YlqF [Candidatus Diapherotrites archaeon]|nr:ribosome biogenesis GTPase YlqF [Candidatus Diapherotrites archaeon]
MNIQWYPGHMAKAKRKITEELKLVDIVIELLDARIPMSSRNPEVDEIVGNKKRIIVLNKSDLADPSINAKWLEYFNQENTRAILVNSLKGNGLKDVLSASKQLMKEKLDRLKSKGLLVKTTRALIIGIPNVGKSTFINRIAGRSAAQTGDRPGVTKSKQWIKVSNELELLDTPGILWPKFEDKRAGMYLAFTGAIKDEILDVNELAQNLLQVLAEKFPEKLKSRYKLEDIPEGISSEELLERIGRKRGCIIAGGEVDLLRASTMLLDEFRGGKIGAISLETPEDY